MPTMTNKYARLRGIKPAEVRFETTPTGQALLEAIATRQAAESRRQETRAALDLWHSDDDWASQHSLDDLQRQGKKAESDADRAAKDCIVLSRDHSAAIIEMRDEQASRIEAAIAERTLSIALATASIVDTLDAIDELHSELIVVEDSTPQQLERYRLRVFTGGARNGLKSISEWINPPRVSSFAGPVRGNPFRSRQSAEFLGRSDLL
jgi:hypothetical protein